MFEHGTSGTRAKVTALALTAALTAIVPTSVVAQDEAMVSCGTEPVELLAYFETGFPFQTALADEFTAQYPNVTWNIREDQFSNLIAQTPRLLTSDNPPDLIRLPTMVDLVRDGLLLDLEPYVTAFGWDQWSPSLLVPHRVAEGGRPRGEGDLYAGGLNYSTTGVFYNKDLAAQIGMTEPPGHAGGVRGLSRHGQGDGAPADHAVERRGEWWRPCLPAAEPDGFASAPPRPSTTGSIRRKARPSTRPPISTLPSTCSSGSRPATSRRTSTPSSTPTPTRASRPARASSPSTVTGRTRASTTSLRATSASSCSRRPRTAPGAPRCPRQ